MKVTGYVRCNEAFLVNHRVQFYTDNNVLFAMAERTAAGPAHQLCNFPNGISVFHPNMVRGFTKLIIAKSANKLKTTINANL